MTAIHRQNDFTMGHCYSPTNPMSFSKNTFANLLGVVRFGDLIIDHCCPGSGCHGGMYQGLHNVMVNLSPIQAINDPVSCGDTIGTGSPNVFIEVPLIATAKVTPQALSLGVVSLSAPVSPILPVTVESKGPDALMVYTEMEGPFISSASEPLPAVLAAGAQMMIFVAFEPVVVGPATGSLNIKTNQIGGGFEIPLTGTGIV